MRSPLLLLAALGLAACGSSDRRAAAEPGAAAAASRGPDQVVLRVPRAGGRVTAYVYPRLDSAVWTSVDSAPPLSRVLGFDGESGLLAALDDDGIPTRVDLRQGTVRAAEKAPLAEAATADGETIYGVGKDGAVIRLTPTSKTWRRQLATPASDVFPQRDGSLLVASTRDGGTTIWRLRPPDREIGDSVRLPGGGRALHTPLGDRVYYAEGTELFGVRSRDLTPLKRVRLEAPVRDAVSTPSGDRLYVVLDGARALTVVDRYDEAVDRSIPLPGVASAVRIDPLGRYVLARAASGDTAWVVAVGTDRVIGAATTAWRADLPLVLPDGAIALADGDDVRLVEGESLRPRSSIAGGADDFWTLVRWNGFRPRAAGLDTPVEFRGSDIPLDTGLAVDALGLPIVVDTAPPAEPDSLPAPPSTRTPPPADSLDRVADEAPDRADAVDAGAPPLAALRAGRAAVALSATVVRPAIALATRAADADRAAQKAGQPRAQPRRGRTTQSAAGAVTRRPTRLYTVQFAAVDGEREARRVAARMSVDGATPNVVPGEKDGEAMWRVVLGPFPTRGEAERVGRASGQSYWVYEGAP